MDINFSEIDTFYGDQSLKEAIESLSNLQTEMSSINCGDLSSGQLLTKAIGQLTTDISSIDAIYTKVNNLKVYLEESSAEIAFLFDYLNGDFLNEDGYIDEDLLAAAIEEKGLRDFYGLLDNANTYNETIANSEFMMALDNGDFSNEDGTLNKEKLNQYLNEHPNVTYGEQVLTTYEANEDFLKDWAEGGFFDREGNLDMAEVERYLELHPNVTCGDQVLTTYEANEDFLRGWTEGRFFDREGNLDMAEVEKYLGTHPNVTCGDQVVTTYQANIDFLTAFGNGDFLENGTLNEDKLNQYLAQHPEVTCGETVKEQFEKSIGELPQEPVYTHTPYPTNSDNLYYVDWNDPYVQTIVVSAWWGLLELAENIGDGLLWLSAAAAAGQESQNIAASWSLDYQMTNQHVPQAIKDTGATLIEYDWTAAGYDWNIEALAIAEEIAYGQIHDIASTIGTLGGYVAMTFVPGGPLVQAGLGGLSASGSSTETALKSGASSDEAFLVGGVEFTLGAGLGYGVDAIGEVAKGATTLGQVAGWTGLGAATAMAEPILNSVLEFNTYGKDMVDSEGNLLYNNWWDYYKESGAALNTLIAGGVGTISVGGQGIIGWLDNTNKANINEIMNGYIDPKGFEGTNPNRTNAWDDYFNKTYGSDNVDLNTGKSELGIDDIYDSVPFIEKSNQFDTEWGDHNRYCGDLKSALRQQYNLLTDLGYDKPYRVFLDEYVSGSFDTGTTLHQRALDDFYNNGGVSVMTEDSLIASLTDRWKIGNRGIGYTDTINPTNGLVEKKGGAWIVPINEQRLNSDIPTMTELDTMTLERARKGITTMPMSSSTDMWEIQYSGEFLIENGITLNSGPMNIEGASAAAMPGCKTFDLTGEGVSYTEALTPRVTFDFDKNTANELISLIENGAVDVIDLAKYGYPGLKFVKVT